jgi:hypothetical protein
MPHDTHQDPDADPAKGSERTDELERPPAREPQGDRKVRAAPAVPVRPEPRKWSRFLVDAWVFPLRKSVLRRLLPWAFLHLGVCALAGLLLNSLGDAMHEMPILPYFGFYLTLVSVAGLDIVMFSTLAWWEFEVISASAWDAEKTVYVPQFDSFDESIVRPGGLVLAALLGAAPPLVVAWALHVIFLRGWEWNGWLLPVGGVCSAVLLPGTVLSVAISDTARAANPLNALRAFLAVPGRYLVACALSLPAAALTVVVVASVLSWRGAGWVIIPLAELAWLLVLTANARILGALFWCNGDRMGWLKEMERERPVPSRRATTTRPADTGDSDAETTE